MKSKLEMSELVILQRTAPRSIRVIPGAAKTLEMLKDEERSIEVGMMRTLIRRYPEKAKEEVAALKK
jgi:hypothetical protein